MKCSVLISRLENLVDSSGRALSSARTYLEKLDACDSDILSTRNNIDSSSSSSSSNESLRRNHPQRFPLKSPLSSRDSLEIDDDEEEEDENSTFSLEEKVQQNNKIMNKSLGNSQEINPKKDAVIDWHSNNEDNTMNTNKLN